MTTIEKEKGEEGTEKMQRTSRERKEEEEGGGDENNDIKGGEKDERGRNDNILIPFIKI